MSEPLPMFTADQIELMKRTVAAGATPDEFRLFLHNAERAGLDPLSKQIYFVKRQGKGVIQVGIDGLRLIADRTEKYAGSDDAEYRGETERGFPAAAKVTVYKMVSNQRCPFSATARWDEYFPGDQQGFQWKRMPHAMLSKCAEALALRKAFPAEMGGLYTHEEMDQAGGQEPPQPSAPVTPTATRPGEIVAEMMDRHEAFGYAPSKWPPLSTFKEPRSDAQRGKAHASWKERGLDESMFGAARTAVLAEFGFDTHEGKGQTMLWIDFILNASADSLQAAIDEGHAANGQESLL